MSNFSKQFAEEVTLPDGSIASSVADIDRYIKTSGMALASDYSPEYLQNIRNQQKKTQQQEMFAEFIQNYKRIIWK